MQTKNNTNNAARDAVQPMKKTVKGPNGIELVLDASEIVVNDPGQGTPAMIYLRDHRFRVVSSSTFQCALDNGEIDGEPMNDDQNEWICGLDDLVTAFFDWHYDILERMGVNSYPDARACKVTADGKPITPKLIASLRKSYQTWGCPAIREVTDEGEGVLCNMTTSDLPCGCRVTGNGTIQFPLTVKQCSRHANA